MKKVLFAIAAMLSFATSSIAQNKDYNKVYASFNAGTYSFKGIGDATDTDVKKQMGGLESFGMMGFNVGYTHAFNIKSTLPAFIEVGGEFGYAAGTESVDSYVENADAKVRMMNIQVPVNFTYRIPVSKNFAIAPFAGINFKFNLSGTISGETPLGETNSYSFFNEDDMKVFGKLFGVKELDETASRFQVGMNVGVNFIIAKKLSIGYRFQPDFNDYFKYEISTKKYDGGLKLTSNNHYVSVGYIF